MADRFFANDVQAVEQIEVWRALWKFGGFGEVERSGS